MAPDLEQTGRPILNEELARTLGAYKGQWVAIDESRMLVVGSGGSAAEAVKAALANKVTDPLVLRVPNQTRRLRIR